MGLKALRNVRIQSLGWILVVLMALLCAVSVATSWETRSLISEIGAAWRLSEDTRSDKRRTLNEIYAACGYGGIIHEFKNYVPRQDTTRAGRVEHDLEVVTGLSEIVILVTLAVEVGDRHRAKKKGEMAAAIEVFKTNAHSG